MTSATHNSKKASLARLKRFYRVLEIVGVLAPFIFAGVLVSYKRHFAWLENSLVEVAGGLVVIGIIYLILNALTYFLHKKIFLELARYCYVGFFIYFISVTGGVNSSFIFLLLIPVISAAAYFDRSATRNIGLVTTLVFAASAFFVPNQVIDSAFITKHIIHVLFVGTLSHLIYTVVIEVLRQRSETEEAAKKVEEVLEVDKLKNDFLSIAQHQLRTPLSGVKWALEMLNVDPNMPHDSKVLIEASLGRVKDSLSIINQMLKTADAEGKALVLSPESVDLVGMVRGIIAELNFVVVRKGVHMSLIAPESILIVADRDKLKAALVNIVDNAIKYSPKGKVEVVLAESKNEAMLTVTDTGIGIAPEDMPFTFVRLHRGKNAVRLEPDESGIGLYASKKVIELHRGTISISSELDKGTIVKVVLPKK